MPGLLGSTTRYALLPVLALALNGCHLRHCGHRLFIPPVTQRQCHRPCRAKRRLAQAMSAEIPRPSSHPTGCKPATTHQSANFVAERSHRREWPAMVRGEDGQGASGYRYRTLDTGARPRARLPGVLVPALRRPDSAAEPRASILEQREARRESCTTGLDRPCHIRVIPGGDRGEDIPDRRLRAKVDLTS